MKQEKLLIFKENIEEFSKKEWNNPELIPERMYLPGYNKEEFLKEFHELYLHHILNGTEKKIKIIENEVQGKLSFLENSEERNVWVSSRLKTLMQKYETNLYRKFANVNNFANNFCDPRIYNEIIIKACYEFNKAESFNHTEFPISEFLREEILIIKQLKTILIETWLLKSCFGEKKSESISSSKKNQLTTNQIILLLHDVGFIQLIENNPLTVQARLISKITGFHEKNIGISLGKLDKKKSELPPQHEKDQAKVEETLRKLSLTLNNIK